MQAAIASTSTIDANASWLSRGPACATSATRRSASSLQVSAGWRARSSIKCTRSLKQSLSPSGLFGMEVESGRGLRRVQKRVSPLVRAQAAGPSPFSISVSLPTMAWIPRTGRWWCIMIWFTMFDSRALNWNSARFNLIFVWFGFWFVCFECADGLTHYCTCKYRWRCDRWAGYNSVVNFGNGPPSCGYCVPWGNPLRLPSWVLSQCTSFLYPATKECESLNSLKPDLCNEVAGNSPLLTVVVRW